MHDRINKWEQAGVIHFWRYKPKKTGYEGWHFTADKQGLSSIIALVEVLASASTPAKRTLNLTKPSDRALNGPFSPIGDRKGIAPVSLQLLVDPDLPEDRWELEEVGERATLQLGRRSIAELLTGLQRLKEKGFGDFTVGPWRADQATSAIWLW